MYNNGKLASGVIVYFETEKVETEATGPTHRSYTNHYPSDTLKRHDLVVIPCAKQCHIVCRES